MMKKILEFPFGKTQTKRDEAPSWDDEFDFNDFVGGKDPLQDFIEDYGDVAQGIRLLALDVDGVLTDGTIYMGNDGEMFKGFNAKDGMGISYALRSGIEVCIITGRKSEIVSRRAAELGVGCVMEGVRDKAAVLEQLADAYRLDMEQVAYIGDDFNDLAPMNICGLSFAPGDAVDVVRDFADYELCNDGGKGAVREAIDLLLGVQGKMEDIIESYIHSGQGDKQ